MASAAVSALHDSARGPSSGLAQPWGMNGDRYRDCARGDASADRACCRESRNSSRGPQPLRQVHRQGRHAGDSRFRGAAGGQADPRHGDQPDACRRGQDHDDGRPRRRPVAHRQELHDRAARAFARPVLRREGRGGRRRQSPDRADGADQPAFHRRFPRHHQRAQPAGGDDRQPYLLGQRARARHPPYRLAARAST